MKNPWTKKNPFLSMWLSGANALAGAARARATAEAKRQTAAALKQGIKDMTAIYSDALTPKPRRKKKSR